MQLKHGQKLLFLFVGIVICVFYLKRIFRFKNFNGFSVST